MTQTTTIQLRELTVRYAVRRHTLDQSTSLGAVVNTPADCASILRSLLEDEASEVFVILCLSAKHRVVAYHEVSRGALDQTIVHPREVFKAAMLANAFAIVLAHNHPSGNAAPSSDDIALTNRLVAAGNLLGIPILDHIVIGDRRHVSMRETGLVAF